MLFLPSWIRIANQDLDPGSPLNWIRIRIRIRNTSLAEISVEKMPHGIQISLDRQKYGNVILFTTCLGCSYVKGFDAPTTAVLFLSGQKQVLP
jgi:hypothetical protein